MLNEAIAALDEFFKAPWVRQEAVFPYWQRIKKELSEVQKPSDNSGYTKCAAEILEVTNYSINSVHGRKIIDIIKRHFA